MKKNIVGILIIIISTLLGSIIGISTKTDQGMNIFDAVSLYGTMILDYLPADFFVGSILMGGGIGFGVGLVIFLILKVLPSK